MEPNNMLNNIGFFITVNFMRDHIRDEFSDQSTFSTRYSFCTFRPFLYNKACLNWVNVLFDSFKFNQTKMKTRRHFFSNVAAISLGATLSKNLPKNTSQQTGLNEVNIVGPKEGYTPHMGTLVSMLNWMREVVLQPVRGMSIKDLDFLLDENANSIGAMLLHLAATERFYQIHTFENKRWGDWSDQDRETWSTASSLGARGRREINGNPLEYYLEKLEEVRSHTLDEFKKRDDGWLLSVDQNWGWGPTNNYCKWFHVCEHESNHNGQIKFIRSRLPSS